jgi:hypothetical protein
MKMEINIDKKINRRKMKRTETDTKLSRKEKHTNTKKTNAQILYNPRHLVQATLHDLVVARDEGGREAMTEADEAGDVGVARVFCDLSNFNQHLDHIFVEATEGFDNRGKKHTTVFLHLRVVLGDLAVGEMDRSIARDRGQLSVIIRGGSRLLSDQSVASVGQDALIDGGEAELVGDL